LARRKGVDDDTHAGQSVLYDREVQYIYNRRRAAADRGLNYAIIVKTDLIKDQWLSYGTFFETGSAVIDSDFEAVTNEIPTAYFAEGFFNMKVTLD